MSTHVPTSTFTAQEHPLKGLWFRLFRESGTADAALQYSGKILGSAGPGRVLIRLNRADVLGGQPNDHIYSVPEGCFALANFYDTRKGYENCRDDGLGHKMENHRR